MSFKFAKDKKDSGIKNQTFATKRPTKNVFRFAPETTLRPGVLGLELTSLTSVSSEVLPTPEQLSSSCRRSSCFRSWASANKWFQKQQRLFQMKPSVVDDCYGSTEHTLERLRTAKAGHKTRRANTFSTHQGRWAEPKGSIPAAVPICMLVSNNVLLKCSSECSFLLPSHETSALHEAGQSGSRTRAATGTRSNQDSGASHFSTARAETVNKFI